MRDHFCGSNSCIDKLNKLVEVLRSEQLTKNFVCMLIHTHAATCNMKLSGCG